MSQGVSFKVLYQIEKTGDVSKVLLDQLCNCIDNRWSSFNHKEDKDYDYLEAEYDNIIGGPSFLFKEIDQIMSVINSLHNSSYGMLMMDTDYGVQDYKCYGNAEFSIISENETLGYIWGTDDYLCLEKTYKTSELTQLFECEENKVFDKLEDEWEKIVPKAFFDIYDESINLFLDCDFEEGDEEVFIQYDIAYHNLTTEQLLKIKDLLANGSLNGWKIHLDEATETNGYYKNVMICPKHNAVLEFETAYEKMGNIKYMGLKSKTCENDN